MLEYFSDPLRIIEVIIWITGLVCVYLNAKENIWAWPIGIVSVALSTVIFYKTSLYSDTLLNGIYVVLGFYGWYQWAYGGAAKTALPVTKMQLWPGWAASMLIGLAGLAALSWFFGTYTEADYVYGDAFTTSFSLVAQVLLARKKLGNWLIWIVVDVVAVYIYFHKGLYIITALYVGYFFLAIYGYLEWKKMMEAEQKQADLLNQIGS
ncbi:MAG: nicotinamide riboside transporter PnuC [Bacteroidia bacterium]